MPGLLRGGTHLQADMEKEKRDLSTQDRWDNATKPLFRLNT